MKLLRRFGANEPDDSAGRDADPTGDESATTDKGGAPRGATTEKKGRPTPKRREAEGRRGPVAPAPQTSKEARARRRATRGTRAERKEQSAQRRANMSDRRARMMAGEEQFLLARDKGPARRYVRDLVDSRRHLVGAFMPFAIVLIITLFLAPYVQSIISLVMLVVFVFMAIEGVFLARRIHKKVLERFPDCTDSVVSLGWYAFVRASQIRKMRTPRPQVNVGDPV